MLTRFGTIPYLLKDRMTGRPTRTVIQFLYQMACPDAKTQQKRLLRIECIKCLKECEIEKCVSFNLNSIYYLFILIFVIVAKFICSLCLFCEYCIYILCTFEKANSWKCF